jgi:hypothetical protein
MKTSTRRHLTPVRKVVFKKTDYQTIQRKENSYTLLVGALIITAIMEIVWRLIKKLKQDCHSIQQPQS